MWIAASYWIVLLNKIHEESSIALGSVYTMNGKLMRSTFLFNSMWFSVVWFEPINFQWAQVALHYIKCSAYTTSGIALQPDHVVHLYLTIWCRQRYCICDLYLGFRWINIDTHCRSQLQCVSNAVCEMRSDRGFPTLHSSVNLAFMWDNCKTEMILQKIFSWCNTKLNV